jgi:DNA ligase D-like protein (predicted 3'-phosphoesterase)
MLPQKAKSPFSSKDWIFEIQWDGIRAIAYISSDVSIQSSDQQELKDCFPELVELLTLPTSTVLDGEIVILKDGKSDQQALENRLKTSTTNHSATTASSAPTYIVFDILEKAGESLVDKPLMLRKQILQSTVQGLRYTTPSIFAQGNGETYFKAALKRGFTSIIGKEKNSKYESGIKSEKWLKIHKDQQSRKETESPLQEYVRKRDFRKTSEPRGDETIDETPRFVIQEHHSRSLHYDFRLTRDGVLKSWAVPKGVPLQPGIRRLAVETEDHPLEYGTFEGVIPKGEYGAGTVKIWDKGSYRMKIWHDDKIEFYLNGERVNGMYVLVKLKKYSQGKQGQNQWLLIKMKE